MNKKWQLIVASAVLTSVFVAPVAEASTYHVQKGDTLTKIAEKHNTSIQNLKEWNRLTNDLIYVNQKLVVTKVANTIEVKPAVTKPAVSNLVTKPVVTQKPVVKPKPIQATHVVEEIINSGTTTHTVVKGDTLTKIAQQYNVSVASLKTWNNLTTDVIFLGQTLKFQVASLPVTIEAKPVVEAPKELAIDEMIRQQLASEQVLTTKPSSEQQGRYGTVLTVAEQLRGIPYLYGGNTTAGFDCSGFVSYVYSAAGFDITRKSSLDYFLLDTVRVAEPVPGDFVFFKNTYIPTISHMGIYLGDNQFIHAGTKGIEIASIETTYWADRFVAYKRYRTN